jgi:uncharacterized membrane protein required for colicin V production
VRGATLALGTIFAFFVATQFAVTVVNWRRRGHLWHIHIGAGQAHQELQSR